MINYFSWPKDARDLAIFSTRWLVLQVPPLAWPQLEFLMEQTYSFVCLFGANLEMINYFSWAKDAWDLAIFSTRWLVLQVPLLACPIFGRYGILIFSCLLLVLFEKRNPDIFVWSLSFCYTVVGLGIYCPKDIAFKIFKAEIVFPVISIVNYLNCTLIA